MKDAEYARIYAKKAAQLGGNKVP